MRLRIYHWRPTLSQMSVERKQFLVRAIHRDGLELVGWRTVSCRTWKGAVRKLQSWLEWEGYDCDRATVEVSEVCDG